MKEAQLVLEIWELIKSSVNSKVLGDIPEPYLRLWEDYGIDIDDLYAEIGDEDPHLDVVMKRIRQEYGIEELEEELDKD